MKQKLTNRQVTGMWFIVTGLIISSFYFFAYAYSNWYLTSIENTYTQWDVSDESIFIYGASAVMTMKFISLIGWPIILVGLLQVITGKNKSKVDGRKK